MKHLRIGLVNAIFSMIGAFSVGFAIWLFWNSAFTDKPVTFFQAYTIALIVIFLGKEIKSKDYTED